MEGLAPPLKCLIEIHAALQNGESVRTGINRYLASTPAHSDFAPDVRRFLFVWEQGGDFRAVIAKIRSPHRRALLDLIATALSGQPILGHLEELRSELIASADSEIREHLELLPIKMLMPLLFFQFPAFLLLLFGPLLNHLLEEINR